MNSIVRNFAVPACVVALGAAAIVWNVERMRTTERKFAEEVKQYQQGADRGDANAEYELGLMYFWGRGVPQDYAQTRYLYQKAADQGFAKGEDGIGALYYYGHGFTQSYSNALAWYHKAADQGDAIAQEALGTMNYYGYGVPQSYTEAITWYRKAAGQNYAKAEYDIGLMYWYGQGVPRDRDEANRGYRRAASHGNKDAQMALGLRFSRLRLWVKIALTIGFVWGLLLMSGLLSPRRLLRDQILRRFVFAGMLCLVTAGMDLFAHSEYCLFPSVWAATVYRFVWLFLAGIVTTMLVTGVMPRASKVLLISSGILFVAMAIYICAIARFDMRALSAIGWRLLVFTACPLGMAISAATHLRRIRKEPESGTPEPPIQNGEAPDAV
jgi:TPR repeat protein